MVQREQYTISLSREEVKKIRGFANAGGETFSGFVRRVLLNYENN